MQTFLIACAVAIIIAVIGGMVLSNVPDSAATAFSTPYVRLGVRCAARGTRVTRINAA